MSIMETDRLHTNVIPSAEFTEAVLGSPNQIPPDVLHVVLQCGRIGVTE